MRMIGLCGLILAGFVCHGGQEGANSSAGSLERGSAVSEHARPSAVTSGSGAVPRAMAAGYILGPGDQIVVRVVNFEEINDKPVSIDLNGSIHLPMVGRISVSGLTVEQAGAEIAKRLQVYVKQPDVSVSVAEFRSQPVSVIGAVKTPGVQQVQGQKSLVEMLSLAGGIDNATAGANLTITRRIEWGAIPLPGATTDPTHRFSVAQVNLKSLLEAKHPEENILVEPYDVISVPRGEMVYVIGEVPKAGGFVLNDGEQMTVLQALSMAGGADKLAQPQHARLLRRVAGQTARNEIPVDLNKVLEGKGEDLRMQPEDILFVPNSIPKRAAIRVLEAAIQAGIGVAVWH